MDVTLKEQSLDQRYGFGGLQVMDYNENFGGDEFPQGKFTM